MDLENEVQQLKREVNDNDQSVLKVRIMYKLKMMAFSQRCQRQVDDALTDMMAMEKRKWEVQEETRMERDLLQQQLQVCRAPAVFIYTRMPAVCCNNSTAAPCGTRGFTDRAFVGRVRWLPAGDPGRPGAGAGGTAVREQGPRPHCKLQEPSHEVEDGSQGRLSADEAAVCGAQVTKGAMPSPPLC